MKDKLLNAKGEELSRLLGEVLQPEKNKHNEEGYKANACMTFCTKCKLEMNEFGVPQPFPTIHFSRPCKHADPVPLTWPEAMRWRDWCSQKLRRSLFEDAMYIVYLSTTYHDVFGFCTWLISDKCEPRHYLIAAARCVLNSKEKQKHAL